MILENDNHAGYIQCLFYERGQRIYCEAYSGFYDAKPRALSKQQLTAIAHQGFIGDARIENFHFDLAVKGISTSQEVATKVLTALHEGYTATAGHVRMRVSPYDSEFRTLIAAP
jgi:hypothetical protein